MSNKIALTILIPVYNGADFLRGLLESFAAFVEKDEQAARDFVSECEILVVNNVSQDASLNIAMSFARRIPNLRVVTPETHVPSAEENVFRSFPLVQGEYTWVLGCDDIVRFEALPRVMRIARDRLYDIAIFNFMISDGNGQLQSGCTYYMKDEVFEGELVDLTKRLGFWWLIAGFSGQIVRTALVAIFDHAALVKQTSPIYSHVTAYLLCLAGKRAAIVNVQNVVYRIVENDVDYWRRMAARVGVFDEYFWTLGYIRQIKHLEGRGIVDRDFLIKLVESNRTGFFRPTIVVCEKLLAQLELMNAPGVARNDRNFMAETQFNELVEFLEDRDLLARPFLMAARTIYNSLLTGRAVSKSNFDDARRRLESYRSSFLLASNCVGAVSDYEIYQLSNTFYAVHRCFRGALLDRIRYLDHAEQAPIVLAGATRDDVEARISQIGIGLDWDHVPASLMRYCSEAAEHGAKAWPAPIQAQILSGSSSIGDAEAALRTAQHQLTTAYKAKNPYLTRLAAWATVLCLKVSKRLLAARSPHRTHRVSQSVSLTTGQ